MSGTVETYEHAALLPGFRQCEGAAVAAYGVLHLATVGPVGRTVGHDAECRCVGERVGDIGVERLVPFLPVPHSVDLPASGHVNVVPCAVVEVGLKEVLRSL